MKNDDSALFRINLANVIISSYEHWETLKNNTSPFLTHPSQSLTPQRKKERERESEKERGELEGALMDLNPP